MSKLQYISTSVLDKLAKGVETNIDRYTGGDFSDLAQGDGWSISSQLDFDAGILDDLVPETGTDAEVHNSLLVWRALSRMRPSLAGENRIWTRLAHVECLEYSRKRWLKSDGGEALAKSIRAHFFAGTWTKCRDDNAISRLWWNAYISNMGCAGNVELGLKTILKTADIRSNFVERSKSCSRQSVATAIIRMMNADERITQSEAAFREFMKAVNLHGGGIVFEALKTRDIDRFMLKCANLASAAIA